MAHWRITQNTLILAVALLRMVLNGKATEQLLKITKGDAFLLNSVIPTDHGMEFKHEYLR